MAKKDTQSITSEEVGNLNIVAGAGISANSKMPGLGKLIEEAMSEAIIRCYAEGVTDPEAHKVAMQEARQRTKDQYYEMLNVASANATRDMNKNV